MSKTTSPPHKPHFFKVILPDSLQQFQIPKAFNRDYLPEHNCERKATLRICRSRKSWDVSINKFGCFTTGWKDFATQHDIQVGDFMVFKHEGNFMFRVIVFDRTACERIYPWQDVSAEDDLTTSKPVRDDAPCFARVLSPCNVSRNFVDLPRKFAIENGLLDKGGMITLRDSNRQSWKVRLRSYDGSSKGRVITIGAGWRTFAEVKELKIGDVCTFKLVSRNSEKVVMEVLISPSKSNEKP